MKRVGERAVPYSECTPHRTLAEGVAMAIGYIMLLILWIVIAIFGIGALLAMFKSAGR